jgi:hypothetical protein
MKTLIGLVVCISVGLFASTKQSGPPVSAAGDLAATAPLALCPPWVPICCDPTPDGCDQCIPRGTECP